MSPMMSSARPRSLGYNLTIEEFPGLEGYVGMEEHDMDHHNPREWSNVGTMAVSYSRYNLGDEDISKINFEIECPDCDGWVRSSTEDAEVTAVRQVRGTGHITLDPVDLLQTGAGCPRRHRPDRVRAQRHHDVRWQRDVPLDTDRWDTSFVGFIYDTPEKVKECIGDNATDERDQGRAASRRSRTTPPTLRAT